MTKEEAIVEMINGRKVTHRYMEPGEYVRMRQHSLVMKTDPSIYWLGDNGTDEYQVSAKVFWHDRSGDQWNDGWQLI